MGDQLRDLTPIRQRGGRSLQHSRIQRQPRSVLIVDGDSITDGHGSPAQHGWGRMLGEMLARPDIRIVNAAFFGSTMGGAAANGSPGSRLTEQPNNVLPWLDTAYAQAAPNSYVLINPMGNNDLNQGDTVATIEVNYQTYCANVHTHHGKCVVIYFVNSTVGAYGSANYATIAQWLALPTNGAGADIVVSIPACPSGVACYQSDSLHPGQPNDAIMARAFIAALTPTLK